MTGTNTFTKSVYLTGDDKVDGLISGYSWDGTITYAFPTVSTSYTYSGEKNYGFSSISRQQQSMALFFLEQSYGNTANDGFSVEGFTNANFEAGSASTATVRFAQSSYPDLSTAWTYYPGPYNNSGDVWFGTAYARTTADYRYPEFGNYAGQTIVHELGHALGLKHGHVAEDNTVVVPDAYDSLEYTTMTYRTYVGDSGTGYKYEQNGAPQTFMMLDIAALQQIYGADYTTNSDDTVYSWNPNQGITYVNGVAAITPAANRIFATIWDGGGIDTYDLTAYKTSIRIDLRAGGYSVFSQGQLAYLGGGPNKGYARGNIFNALLYQGNVASLIENVKAGSGNDTIIGNEADNTLWGNAGNDTLDGGVGADTLIGGTGDDTYIVDDLDVVVEGVNAGSDLIKTTLSVYSLATIANVERLAFIGSGAFTGTGNSLANVISGGAGSDTLDGGAGADTLIGGAGNDLYLVDSTADVVSEAANAGIDEIQTALATYSIAAFTNVENLTYTGTGKFSGIGNAAANRITGAAGDDTLNGGAGVDTLIGGAGNDTYLVDLATDVVVENAGDGVDTIKTALSSYSLAAISNVENLTYIGTAAFVGTGNDLDNVLMGGAAADKLTGGLGNDTLIGGAGSDRMSGGLGDDIYVVDVATDVVLENLDEGTDTIKTTLGAYTLGANVENLTYIGTAAFAGIGNAAANWITGGAGADTLDGNAGDDRLVGGAGNDTYIVDTLDDTVVEEVGGGVDLIKTALATYSLASIANVENLAYVGTADFTGAGNALDNVITGGAGSDTLSGDAGNDTLNGGAGADALAGGLGDDTYIIDNAGDTVSEDADEGIDTVRTSLASYTLGANVENLTNIGTAAFNGIGNALNNIMTGGAGIDRLAGGAGDDIYIVSTRDIVIEDTDAGIDTVRTNLASYTLGANVENLIFTSSTTFTGVGNGLDNVIKGGKAADTLSGGAGNDTLDGGAGADRLIGGTGDDIFIVDNTKDVVTEAVGQGNDTVKTGLAALTLAANVEALVYTGAGNFLGTGNALANTISGGSGNDILNGGAGADTLIGGLGNDIYVADNAFDVIVENDGEGIDTVQTALASYVLAANVENLTYTGTIAFAGTGNALGNTITGGVAADTLSGGDGNDTLNGGKGADTLIGGLGDDIYIVDSAADVVTENADAGIDTVKTALAAYSLASKANVENLTYAGTVAFVGTGNGLANTIRGGVGADILDGGAGIDTLIGGLGNDTYIVDDLADIVTEAVNAGTDLIKTALSAYALTDIANVEKLAFTGSGDFVGTGNALANVIAGGAGNDTLDGGAGADTLIGGAGNDVYIVDSIADVVTEAANAGTDEIRTSLGSYSIAALVNVENLSYTGGGNFSGTGNASANTISGGAGNDTLNGGAGVDRLIGGLGNDTYIVDSAADVITENADEGIDTVKTALASYSLAARENVENLTYTGKTAFAGTGNDLDNVIVGGSGQNTLTGGAGNDTLTGGAAADTFVYLPNWGHDTITNFVATGTAHDTIRIDQTIFADWATLLAASSQSGADALITADSNNSITLQNVLVSSLQSSDFRFA